MSVRSETVKDIKAGDKLMGHKIKGLALVFWLLKKNQKCGNQGQKFRSQVWTML